MTEGEYVTEGGKCDEWGTARQRYGVPQPGQGDIPSSLEQGLSFIYTKQHKNFKEHSGTFSLLHPIPCCSLRFYRAI